MPDKTLRGAIKDVADAIRSKTGKNGLMTIEEMPTEIESIETGGVEPTGKVNITTMQETNVADYATAQVVEANLTPENVKKGVTVLGVEGVFEDSVLDALMQETF